MSSDNAQKKKNKNKKNKIKLMKHFLPLHRPTKQHRDGYLKRLTKK